MAPRKRGGSARVQPSKNEKKPNSKDAHEEPKEERKSTSIHVEEENPPAKKPRRSSRTASVPNGQEAGEEVKGQVVVENNVSEDAGKSKNIVIEHCKQCQCFKVRALKVEKELKGAIPNVEVTINPEKPRRGCFEIRDGEGNIFLSLQDMPRPFTKLKQYDLDGTISEIIEKIK